MPLHSPEHTILAAKRLVESDKRSEIRLNANGGNSILVVCDPGQEPEYIAAIRKNMPDDAYDVIDLNSILVEFVDINKTELEENFNLLKGSVNQVFKSPAGEDGPNLFKMIISVIRKSLTNNKIPVLIHSGALYGSGIENIHIMEHELVMKSSLPLIILYPATHHGEKLMFLGNRPASRYRCMIID